MRDIDPDYTLRWPRALFIWEANQLLKAPDSLALSIPVLLEEAFEETDAKDEFYRKHTTTRNLFDPPTPGPDPAEWLRSLIDSDNIQEREAPAYWANRHGLAEEAEGLHISLSSAFFEAISDLQEHGYFPRVYPKPCVDQDWKALNLELQTHLRRATNIRFDWPVPPSQRDSYPTHLLYTLMEYFHDQAQRPRAYGTFHDYGECGWHYDGGANKNSGSVVYRWRMNELLREHGAALELSSNRGERGRLVSRLPGNLDEPVAQILDRRTDPTDEVAHAVRDYRTRHAGRPQKVAAVTLLAGEVEKRKLTLREALLTKDESALFRIANEFAIRHRNEKQRADYADEFLDWVFHVYVATMGLIDAVDARESN